MLVLCKLKCCHYQGVSLLSTDERGEHWSRLVRWIEEVFHVDIHLLSKHFSNWGHDTDHRVGNVTRSILPPCSIHGMRGSRETSCDGLANKNIFQILVRYFYSRLITTRLFKIGPFPASFLPLGIFQHFHPRGFLKDLPIRPLFAYCTIKSPRR